MRLKVVPDQVAQAIREADEAPAYAEDRDR